MSRDTPRVAITGVGIVSALGVDRETSFARLVAGDVGIAELTLFDPGEQKSRLAAEVREWDALPSGGDRQQSPLSRTDALALKAAQEALGHSGLGPRTALSLAVGGTTGGMLEAEHSLARFAGGVVQECARHLLSYPLSTTATRLREQLLVRIERAVTVCSACSSGANAIAVGGSWVQTGLTEVALVGGTDGLCRLTYLGFNALGVMDAEPCRPFDARRAGLTLGEGAAFLVLESEAHARARSARVVAWLAGYAVGAEAYHITHPEPSAVTSVQLLRSALEHSGLGAEEIDYVNAHGTATPQNDEAEARAIGQIFGPDVARVRVSSCKGQVGHTLGAAGAMEAAFTALACERSVAPPTAGLTEPDPALPLRHVRGSGEPLAIRAALSSSFGFGGAGTVLVVENAERPPRVSPADDPELVVTALATIGPRGELSGTEAVEYLSELPASPPELRPLVERLDPARSRRFDRVSALVTLCAERALGDAGLRSDGVGLVSSSAFGNVERSVAFLHRAFSRGPRFASPAEFPHLLPSAAAGNASIYLGLTGPVLTVSDVAVGAELALGVGAAFVGVGLCDAVVVGSAEPEDLVIEQLLGPLHGHGANESAGGRGEGAAFFVLERADASKCRGRAPLARLCAQWEADGPERIAAPRQAQRSVLVSAETDDELRAWLGASPWATVARRRLESHGIPSEVRSGFALAGAIAALACGEHDEALVLSLGVGTAQATLLARVTAPSSGAQ